MNNEEARTVNVPLNFLSASQYSLTSWEDGKTPTSLTKNERHNVGPSDAVTLRLANSGGAVIRLTTR
jgi:hypothetical protein